MAILSDEEVFGGPSVMSDEDVFGARADPKIGQPEELTWYEKLASGAPDWMSNARGSKAGRFLQGMADMPIGAMQTVANALPDATGIPQAVNKRVGDLERDYQSQRMANTPESLSSLVTGKKDPGTDWARIGGMVASPANIALARMFPAAASGNLARAGWGAGIGAATAAMDPVTDDSKSFWGQKAVQVGGGAIAGGVLGPVLGKVGDAVVRRLGAAPAADAGVIEQQIAAALKEMGQTISDIPPAQLDALRLQVQTALQGGKKLDPAAAMRQADFESLGMKGTLGQVTREPMQWARERDLRGVSGVGEDLSARFQDQGRNLQGRLADPAAGAQDAYNAGNMFTGSLKNTDEILRKHVSGLYGEARASTGKDLDVPLTGLAQDYAGIAQRYGSNVPDAIRSRFAQLGLDPANPSNQKRVFTLENANSLMQDINKLDPGWTNPPVSSALGEVRSAVRAAIEGADATGGPFAPAVKAASERFKLHDAVPALEAAAKGQVAPDDFVRKFVIGGKTDEVRGLASVLQRTDPEAYQQARAQIADTLKRAAFGENAAGDASAAFSPTRYMATFRRVGADKIAAFFSDQEVQQLMTMGRVGGYIHQVPNAAAPNFSNTASTLVNLLGKVPGASSAFAIGNRVAGAVKDRSTVNNALRAQLDALPADLSAEQRNYLAWLMGGGSVAGGLAAGSPGY